MRKHEWKWVKNAQEGNTAFHLRVFAVASPVESMKLLSWYISSAVSFFLYKWGIGGYHVTGWKCPSYQQCTKAGGIICSGLLKQSSSSNLYSSSLAPFLPDLPFVGTPLVRHPFAEFLAMSTPKMWGHSSGSLLNNHCNKRTQADFQQVKAWTQFCTGQWGHAWIDTGKWDQLQTTRAGADQSPSSPTRTTIDLEDGAVAGSSKSTGDLAFSDSESSRENVDDSDLETASRDCF